MNAATTISVEGMMCDACAGHVREALSKLPGVTKADVDLETKTAVVEYDSALVDLKAMVLAIEEEGYAASEA
jgi:copper chaperone CopZ